MFCYGVDLGTNQRTVSQCIWTNERASLCLQELGDVDDGGEDNDGEEVVDDPGAEPPSHRVVSVVERVADSRVPAGQLLIREHYKSESLCSKQFKFKHKL